MKLMFLTLFVISLPLAAQTKFDKTIPFRAGQKLYFNFDFPAVKIHTWDKPDVLITGTVSINRGEHDSAFELDVRPASSDITITSQIKNKEGIPRRIIIKKDDREYYFKTGDYNNPEVQKFLDENGKEYSYMSSGVIQETNLDVFVPKGADTKVTSKYGLVEVTHFDGPLTIDAKYGGIDATIPLIAPSQLTARTQYGEILTNLDVKFDQRNTQDRSNKRWTEISAGTGKGPGYLLESKYGNVYLRKSK